MTKKEIVEIIARKCYFCIETGEIKGKHDAAKEIIKKNKNKRNILLASDRKIF